MSAWGEFHLSQISIPCQISPLPIWVWEHAKEFRPKPPGNFGLSRQEASNNQNLREEFKVDLARLSPGRVAAILSAQGLTTLCKGRKALGRWDCRHMTQANTHLVQGLQRLPHPTTGAKGLSRVSHVECSTPFPMPGQ